MENIYQFIKNINLKKVLTVLFASSLLIVSTACSNNDVAQVGEKAVAISSQNSASNTYDDYDAEQSYKGGMNGYNDDPRYNSGTKSNANKVQTLMDTAKRRKADDLGDFTDNVLERSVVNEDANEKATKAFSNKLERNKDKAVDYVDDKSDKLQRNLEKVPGGAKDVFEGAVETAQDAAEDATKATKKTSKNIKNNFEELGDDLS